MHEEAEKHNSLSIEEVRELWSKTYNKHGKPDWSHIFHLYNENIIFHDSIQKIEGKDEFLKMINRLTNRCKSLHMELYTITKTDNIVMMDWTSLP
jgi:ketosteroid isomerase-like protein